MKAMRTFRHPETTQLVRAGQEYDLHESARISHEHRMLGVKVWVREEPIGENKAELAAQNKSRHRRKLAKIGSGDATTALTVPLTRRSKSPSS